MTHFITYGQSQQQYQRKMPYNEAKKQQNLVIQSLLHVSSPRGHQLPKKVYGFQNLWISSKDFTDFS